MDPGFWHRRWKKNEIGFHESEVNPLLTEHFKDLSLEKGSRVFLPLCGKTLDIAWLLSNGYRVSGAELSETAVEQLFTELELEPTVSRVGELKHYSEKNIDIFVGDIFDLSRDRLGPVAAVYDRAALVALPKAMRKRYTTHLMEIVDKAPQLLLCFVYNQDLMKGPPFSISDEEVFQHYRGDYDLDLIASADVVGGLKGKCAARETVWLLRNE